MSIGGLSQFLHHTNKVLIVPWDEFPISIQVWFPRSGSRRPIGSRILFSQSFPLPQITQPDQRCMAYAEVVIAPVNDNSFHGCS
jgi:hypothetical protein